MLRDKKVITTESGIRGFSELKIENLRAKTTSSGLQCQW